MTGLINWSRHPCSWGQSFFPFSLSQSLLGTRGRCLSVNERKNQIINRGLSSFDRVHMSSLQLPDLLHSTMQQAVQWPGPREGGEGGTNLHTCVVYLLFSASWFFGRACYPRLHREDGWEGTTHPLLIRDDNVMV